VDFRNAVLIMTSNVGSQHIVELGQDDEAEIESRVMQALRAHFKPEFLNRVDEVILYHQLQKEQIHRIADIQLARVQDLLGERRLTLELTDAAKTLLGDRGFDPQYGARPLKRVIQRMVQDPLALRILEGEFPEGAKILADVSASGDALDFRAA
jgi:ATP-dependent Clp protease ATP-binding subunit ClpB